MTQSASTSKNEKADAQTSAFFNSQSTSAPIFGQSTGQVKALATVKRTACIHGRANAQWTVVVEKCPYCAGRHIHGGGTDEVPILGHRVAHCVDGTGGGYFLTLEGGAA